MDEFLENGQRPSQHVEDWIGSTPEEGGATTKEKNVLRKHGRLHHRKDTPMGSGNWKEETSGATIGGKRADEGLDEEAKNLGAEADTVDRKSAR